MKSKQLLMLIVAAVVLGTAGVVAFRQKNAAWHAGADSDRSKPVLGFPIDQVAGLKIQASGSSVTIQRGTDGWTVAERGNYPASFDQVSRAVKMLWEMKPAQKVQVGPSQMGRLELEAPSKEAPNARGTLVELQNEKGEKLAALLLGKNFTRDGDDSMGLMGAMPAGRYVMPINGANQVFLVNQLLGELTADPVNWLNREFVKVARIRSLTVSGTTPQQIWKVVRVTEGGEWTMPDATSDEKLDSAKVPGVDSTLGAASIYDVLPADAKLADLGLDQPAKVIVETFDGPTYEFQVGKKQEERFPVRVVITGTVNAQRTPEPDEKADDKKRLDDEFAARSKQAAEQLAANQKIAERLFLLPAYTFDNLLKDRSQLFADKPAPAPAESGTSAPSTPAEVSTPPVSVTTPPVSIADIPKAEPTPSATLTPAPKKKQEKK